MQISQAIQQRIIDICKEQNITLNKLSTNSGISYSTVFSMFYGKSKSPKLTTILHICEGCNMELSEFFNDPLFKISQLETEEPVNPSDSLPKAK